jgi:hypothetical protein
MVNQVPAWQGHLMHRSGRLMLIKTMLATIWCIWRSASTSPLVPQDHDKDLQSVTVDQHRGCPWREMSGSLDQGAKTSPSQQVVSHGLQPPLMALAQQDQRHTLLDDAPGEGGCHLPGLLPCFHKLRAQGWLDHALGGTHGWAASKSVR